MDTSRERSRNPKIQITDSLKRLTESGSSVMAIDNLEFRKLVVAKKLEPSTVIGNQRMIKRLLPSGNSREITITSINPEAVAILDKYSGDPAILGEVRIRIGPDRPSPVSSDLTSQQYSELHLIYDWIGIELSSIFIPQRLDPVMEKETSEEWLCWGVELWPPGGLGSADCYTTARRVDMITPVDVTLKNLLHGNH